MEVTPSALDLIFRTANLNFQDLINRTPTWFDNVATTIPSASREVSYAWLNRLPTLRKWIGDRIINAASAQVRRVLNVPFEHTLGLDKYDIQDDQLGVFYLAVKDQASLVVKWPDNIIAQFFRDMATATLGDGTSNLGFDGVPCVSQNHPLLGGVDGPGGSTVQSNLYLNKPLTWDNYVAVRIAMMSLLGADGKPLNILPNLLIVPPQLESMGKLILEADSVPSTAGVLAGGVTAGAAAMTNTYKGTAKLLVIPELADKPNNWWLMDASRVVKPILWQLRQAAQFTQLVEPNAWNVFNTRQFLYGVEARGAAAETLWFLTAGATSSTTTY